MWRFLAWMLIVVASARGLMLVSADPMLAVANNYDMIRVQACIDAWPVRDASIPLEANNYRAPLERYRFVAGIDAPCFVTSDLVFTTLAWPGMWLEQRLRADATFSLRWQGVVKMLLLIAFASVVTRNLTASGRHVAATGHAAVVALVLVDPGNTLYFNSFYAEAAAVLFLYALLGSVFVVLGVQRRATPAWLACIAVSAAMLALTKIQHVLLPLLIVAMLMPLAMSHARALRALLLAIVIGGLFGGALQMQQMRAPHTASIAEANLVNAVFFSVLPNAHDAGVVLEALGLPARCAAQSGANWYTAGMHDRRLCPEAVGLTRSALLHVLARDPALAWRVLVGGIERARPWIPPQRGMVEDADLATLPGDVATLDRALDALPGPLWSGTVLVLPPLALLIALRRRRSQECATNSVLVVLCGMPLAIIATAVFGDGYVDLSSHAHLAFGSFFAAALVLVLALPGALSRRAPRNRSSAGRTRWDDP